MEHHRIFSNHSCYILGRDIGAHHAYPRSDEWFSADILLGAGDSAEISAGGLDKLRRRSCAGLRGSHADTDQSYRRSVAYLVYKYIGYQFRNFIMSPFNSKMFA